MNTVILEGIIKNIQYSHTINNIEYDKAQLLVQGENGKENLINLKFKKFSNPYTNNEKIKLMGNVRTFTYKIGDKTKVEIYVFTYFDEVLDSAHINHVSIDGKICKTNGLKKTKLGKDVIDFILANNIETSDGILNCYVPCVAWGKQAKEIAKMNIGDSLSIHGKLYSRNYKKYLDENNFEFRVAHEICVSDILKIQ